MIKKIVLSIGVLIVCFVISVFIAVGVTAPQTPPAKSASFKWLQPGPYPVDSSDYEWADTSRPTQKNREFPGAEQRSLPATIWYPAQFDGPYPLIVYSHGFGSSRGETEYLLRQLASYGYVVVAADFPLTSGSAPGGPNINDVSQQPADVSFLIDTVLALAGNEKPYSGEIDADRIGIMGLSLGGFSTSLTAYHPRLREPRVKAAISIAGPSANLTEKFYTQNELELPFLMIAGTADRLIDFASNAAVIPQRVPDGGLLSIDEGNHIGFVGMADPIFRFFFNADSVACLFVEANIDASEGRANEDLFSSAEGIVFDASAPVLCQSSVQNAIHPGRQHMITQLGALSFSNLFWQIRRIGALRRGSFCKFICLMILTRLTSDRSRYQSG